MEEFVPFLRRDDEPQPAAPTSPQLNSYAQVGARRLAQPRYAARIAVYDDMIAPPRVIIIEPCDIATYLTQIIQTVYQLMTEQGGDLPHSMIRELVENFIHAEFIEPTISILDRGQTLVFSDQGPGIANKAAALKPSFSTATDEMKHYIRGVGSGLPMVESYLKMRQGTMTIEDNLDHGTIVTISFAPRDPQPSQAQTQAQGNGVQSQAASPTIPTYAPYAGQPATQPQTFPQQPFPAYPAATYPYGQIPYPYAQSSPAQPSAPSYTVPSWASYQAIPPYPYTPAPFPAGGVQPSGAQLSNAQLSGEIPLHLQPTEPFDVARSNQEHDEPTEPMPAVQPASDYPVPPPEIDARMGEILRIFETSPLVGGKELQAILGVSPATASRRFKELEAAGLAAKRGQKYILTPQGRDALALITSDLESR